MPFDQPVLVSRPSLPSLEAYSAGLQEIWGNRWMTNGGPVLARFRSKLAVALQVPDVSLFANGALALQIALQGLRLEGEVVTSPFSYVATSNAIAQCGLTPVFADIEPGCFTLDPDRVEAAITPRTSAILAVHVFGMPCQVDRLQAIASRHGLALIYDAAHAFGVTVDGQPVAGFGDVTMFSLHATKLFHSIEGGALAFRDPSFRPVFEQIANHGLGPDGDVELVGLNAKMSEVHALMGDLMLPTVADAMRHGAEIEATYREGLQHLPGLDFARPPRRGVVTNHSFVPLVVHEREFGLSADGLQAELRRFNVFARRYFNPLISSMSAFRDCARADPLTCANQVVHGVLALPTYTGLSMDDVGRICGMVAALHAKHAPAQAARTAA